MLKSLLSKTFHRLAAIMPPQYPLRLSRQRFFAPFYHVISNEPLPHVRHLYPVRSPEQFGADLDFLLRHLEPVSLEALWQLLQEGRLQEKPRFFLSFDDGLRECAEVVAPILLQKGIPATFFLNPDFIDSQALMFRYKASLLIEENRKRQFSSGEKAAIAEAVAAAGVTGKTFPEQMLNVQYHQQQALDEVAKVLQVNFAEYLAQQQPYMTTVQVRELIKNGFTTGAHSLDHPEYRFVSFEEQLRQTRQSIAWIDHYFEMPVKTFAFPFTDFGVSRKFFSEVLEGPEPLAHLTFGGAGLKHDVLPQHIQRFPMEGTLLPAKDIVAAEFLYYIFKAPFGKNRIKRK